MTMATDTQQKVTEFDTRYLKEFIKRKSPTAVLIVEDDLSFEPLWRHVFQQISPSTNIDWALSEEQAERKIIKRARMGLTYDLVIADVFLSGKKTGVDLWNQFSEDVGNFVFVSGLSKEKFDKLMSLDFSSPIFMQKPLSPKQCRELIQNLL